MLGLYTRNIRNYLELEKQYNNVQNKNEELETELFEKNESLTKLTTVSKSLFQEYDMLKNKYETETGAMHMALSDASNWYRENKVLRRRTLHLDVDYVDEGVDPDDSSGDHDLENLRESVKQLSVEIGRLQSELNAAKLLEFETIEQNINLSQDLETEKKKTKEMEAKIIEIQRENEQLLRISKMLQKDLEETKQSEEIQKDEAVRLRKEADNFKKERNVLAHQSTVLMQGINSDEGFDEMLLFEIEELKRTIEEERNKHNLEITALQDKLDQQESNSQVEILEERLKLVETELDHALKKLEETEKESITIPPPPPPPLPFVAPPPPPPPPLTSLAPPTAPLRTKKKNSLVPLETCIDSCPEIDETKKPAVNGVNDDIINQIKTGMFTLKKRKSDSGKKERETPKAMSEMLNILGSLRKTNRSKITVSPKFADVQL
ncbi:shootin-1-like isoform X2 [Onthophagus taurus]|uniref:shootin-1-like isoform X2 n=1 Tax=Onthophagus taurus TaxID=166361 RepID=UPI0039BEC48A